MVGVYLGPIVNSMVSVKEITIKPVRDLGKLRDCMVQWIMQQL